MDATALYKFPSGLYVVSADDGEKAAGCVINTGLQLTGEPLQVQVVVNKGNFTEGAIMRAGHFALSVLDERADMELIARFGFQSSADADKFEGIECGRTELGDPHPIQAVCAVISCRVVKTLDVGTHTLFVGEVADAEVLSDEKPLTYAYYHAVLKGKTPPKASSFVPGAEEPAGEDAPAAAAAGGLHHFRCTLCGYVYETEDEELPDDFTCPLCGVGKELFEKID